MSSKIKRYDANPEKQLILEGLEFFESSENPDIVDPEEIKNLMDKLELKDKMPFIYDLISELCINKSNAPLTKSDFIAFIENKLNDTETKEGIHTIYNVFADSNGDTLPMTNFCRTAREIGDMEKDEELKNLLKEAEMTGKELNFDEFHEIMTKEQSKSNKPKIEDNNQSQISRKSKIKNIPNKKLINLLEKKYGKRKKMTSLNHQREKILKEILIIIINVMKILTIIITPMKKMSRKMYTVIKE